MSTRLTKRLGGLMAMAGVLGGLMAFMLAAQEVQAQPGQYPDPFATPKCTDTCVFIPCCPPEVE